MTDRRKLGKTGFYRAWPGSQPSSPASDFMFYHRLCLLPEARFRSRHFHGRIISTGKESSPEQLFLINRSLDWVCPMAQGSKEAAQLSHLREHQMTWKVTTTHILGKKTTKQNTKLNRSSCYSLHPVWDQALHWLDFLKSNQGFYVLNWDIIIRTGQCVI